MCLSKKLRKSPNGTKVLRSTLIKIYQALNIVFKLYDKCPREGSEKPTKSRQEKGVHYNYNTVLLIMWRSG